MVPTFACEADCEDRVRPAAIVFRWVPPIVACVSRAVKLKAPMLGADPLEPRAYPRESEGEATTVEMYCSAAWA